MGSIGVYRDFSKLELLRHLWSISGGHHLIENGDVYRDQWRSRLDLSVHVDGHPIGTTPVI
jgi:hypothetical protein